MPTPVFAGGQTYNGSFRADKLKVKICGTTVAGLLFQSLQFTFQQQVSMLYELGVVEGQGQFSPVGIGTIAPGSNTSYVYYVGGRAQGSASIGRILGPASGQLAFLTTFNDVCKPADLEFDASNGCEGTFTPGAFVGCNGAVPTQGIGVAYNLQKCVLTSIGVSVTAQDVVINEQSQLMFSNVNINP